MSGKKSVEKSNGAGGIKSFFVSKATPQLKVNEVSPQSDASGENCIDLSKEEKTEKKQAKSKTPEPNLFFMSKSQRQQALAAQREAKEREVQQQKEAEELLVAQQREARIQEEIIRSRKETNLLLLGKSGSKVVGASKSHNPFFLARAPAPIKASQSGSSTVGLDSVVEATDSPEAHFPPIQNVGLDGRLGTLLQQIEGFNKSFGKRHPCPSLESTAETVTTAVTAMCVPDWATSAFSDYSAQEYTTLFALPRGRGGAHSVNRAATGQARMYPLAQAALNLRALWLMWIQKTLTDGTISGIRDMTGVTKLSVKVSPSAITIAGANQEANVELSAVVKTPTAVLTRWLSDWAARRARTTGIAAVTDLTLTASNINSRNSKSKISITPSLTRTSSRSQASSAGSGGKSRGQPTNNDSVKKGSRVLKRRRGVVQDESEEEDEADGIEDSSSEEEDQGSDCNNEEEEEDEWQSSEAEEGSESEVECRSSRRGSSSTLHSTSSSRHCVGGTEDEKLLNVMVLEGPSGSGKSAAVHDTARLLGYKVIEVNASHTRNGASIKKLISEAAQSAHILDNMSGGTAGGTGSAGNGAATTEMNLILFDEVDIAFDDEDSQLYSTIQHLAHISKCPILLTSEQPLPFFKALHAKHVKFTRPSYAVAHSSVDSDVGVDGKSEALQGLLQSIRAVSGSLQTKNSGNGSCNGSGSSTTTSYVDVTVLDDVTTTSTSMVAKNSSNSKSTSALAAMFSSAKKPTKPTETNNSNTTAGAGAATTLLASPVDTLASFSSADLTRLQVLCGLSDGDLRAALSSVQLFSEHFLGAIKPTITAASTSSACPVPPPSAAGSVVDLTASPAAAAVRRRVSNHGLVDLTCPSEEVESCHVPKQEPVCSFGKFLSETLKLDFALFDSNLQVFEQVLLKELPRAATDCATTVMAIEDSETSVTTHATIHGKELYAPVVHDVHPRFGLVAGGFLITISGAHFLQHSASSVDRTDADADESATQAAEVRVFLNGSIACPCVLKSDSTIVAYVPPVPSEGVYTVHVEVHLAVPLPSSTQKVVVARSLVTGVGAAWIRLRQRHFPLVRSANNSTQKLVHVSSQSKLTNSGARCTENKSPGSSSSGDEGCAAHKDTGGANERVVKRLWSCTQEVEQDATSAPEQGGASLNNKRRKRRVISDDSDEASDYDENKDEKGDMGEKNSREPCDQGDLSLAESEEGEEEEDQEEDNEEQSEALPSSAVKATSAADASMLESLVLKIQASLLATLNKVKCNGHSEAFLVPVDDRDVPGYSKEIAHPMDLGTVTESLKEGLYNLPQRSLVVNAQTGELVCQKNVPDVASFVEDVRLIWKNCIQFNDKDSPFTRSAYLASCLFDNTLRETLQQAFVSFPGARVLTEDHNGAYICVRLEYNGENVFLVPRCTVFDRCMKMKKVLASPRVKSLLAQAQRQKSDHDSGDIAGDIANSSTVTQDTLLPASCSSLNPALNTAQPFLSAEEALAPERLEVSTDKTAGANALNEAQTKRQLLLHNTTSVKNLVPGLQCVPSTARASMKGLEYDNEESAPVVLLKLPVAAQDPAAPSTLTATTGQADLLALFQLSALSDAFSVADRFTSVATSLAEYNCLQHEDETRDCADRCWTACNTATSAHEGSQSHAQMYTAARYYSLYGDCVRQGALQAMTEGVRVNAETLQQSSYRAKEGTARVKKTGYEYLDSAYLEHSLKRTEHVRLLSTVAHRYSSSTGNRAGSVWVNGLIVQRTLTSLCFVSRPLAVDVFPLLGVMCRSEMSNDADETYQQQRRLTDYSAEMNGLSRRSSRRGNSGGKEPELARKHKCFVEMKSILNHADEKVLSQLADVYDL